MRRPDRRRKVSLLQGDFALNQEALIEKFSIKNIDSFAFAAREIHDILIERYETTPVPIVIPSRGAHPICNVVGHLPYIDKQLEVMRDEDQGDFEPKFYDLRANNKIYIPFTSDYHREQSITPKQIRKFWTSVMLSVLTGKETVCFQLYKSVNRFLSGNLGIVGGTDGLVCNASKGEFVLIDTCISGRAISEIVESLHEMDCDNFFIIAIKDKSKGDLGNSYKDLILREEAIGRLKIIEVDELFTEDQSPLMNMGCGAVVFPELMEACLERIPHLQTLDAVGAGTCILNFNERLRGTSLNAIRGITQHFIYLRARHLSGFEQRFRTDDQLESHMRDELRDALKESGDDCLGKEKTKSIFSQLSGISEDRLDISSSHVVRCTLTQDEINSVITSYRQSLY